jgi:NAD(P)-dependent dehydrogenase (short-subunit alcohol dehydrogenase family)
MRKLANILITGGTGGVGSSIVLVLKENRDDTLFVTYRNEEEKKHLEENCGGNKDDITNIKFLRCDLLDEYEIDSVMQKLTAENRIDIVIHCAVSDTIRNDILGKSWNEYSRHNDLQVKSLFLILKKVLPAMKENRHGKIITILSEYVYGKPPEKISDYITAKYALLGFSKCLASEFAKYGIFTNSISPGIMKTSLTASLPEKYFEIVESQTPTRKLTKTDDVADIVKFLCRTDSNINGENFIVNGGYMMK